MLLYGISFNDILLCLEVRIENILESVTKAFHSILLKDVYNREIVVCLDSQRVFETYLKVKGIYQIMGKTSPDKIIASQITD